MRALKTVSFVLMVTLIISAAISAVDLGHVTVKNKFQANLVDVVVNHAITRVENRFLVSLDENQQQLLTKSGIEFEILSYDVDLNQTYLFWPGHKDNSETKKVIDIYNLTDIGAGMKIGTPGRLAASSINELTGRKSILLSELNIPISYMSKTVAGAMQHVLDFPTDSIANLVNQDSIYAYDTRLEDFVSRYIHTDSIHMARDWLIAKFEDWGYTDVTTQTFWVGNNSIWAHNVVVVKQGYAEPDKVIVVGGHYDSITYGQPTSAYEYAPGADDNASGTSAVLEIARVLADIPLRKTVVFIPFSAEEVGLYGSRYAADSFYNSNVDVEVMYNFDMIGYTESGVNEFNVMGNPDNINYANVTFDAANRVTSLNPVMDPLSGSSDHWPFHENGFNFVYSSEFIFNYDGWHTDIDNATRLNFSYMADIIRSNAAAINIVANSAHATEIEEIVDMGDGQSLEIFWTDCTSEYDYKIYYSTSSGNYNEFDYYQVPPGECSYLVEGLSIGLTYYFMVTGSIPDGYPAIYAVEGSEYPHFIPRAPKGVEVSPVLNGIDLIWRSNREADLSHYRIYRDNGSGFVLYEDNFTDTTYVDYNVSSGVTYEYKIKAIDFDLIESEFSDTKAGNAATFDQGILVVDETNENTPMPSQSEQEAILSYYFAPTTFALDTIINDADRINRFKTGKYSSIFWFDDDLSGKYLNKSIDTLDWYLSYPTNFFFSGFRTFVFSFSSPVSSSHLLYREMGMETMTKAETFDFSGAKGVGSWPDLQIDPAGPLGAQIPFVNFFTMRPEATPIYLYDSNTDNPSTEDQVCGYIYESANGKRIVLGFPVSFLTDISAKSIINYAKAEFAEVVFSYVPGDLDGSGDFDIADIVYGIDYFFNDGPPPVNINSMDVNSTCVVDISDLVFMIDYLFNGGPPMLHGCVE